MKAITLLLIGAAVGYNIAQEIVERASVYVLPKDSWECSAHQWKHSAEGDYPECVTYTNTEATP